MRALDTNPEELSKMKNEFLCGLQKTDEEIHRLCTETIHQSTSNLWYTERRRRLTASYFGKICKMRPSTNPANTIKTLLYSTFSGNKYTDYGKDHEPTARKHFSKMIDKDVTECKFFVGKDDYCYLGASPDGLIDDDGLVESKCPYKGKDSTPETINFATFVKGKFKPEVDLYEQFRKCGVFEEFNKDVGRVANNASSLLHDVDNNLTVNFNSIVNKFVGEKRIHFSVSESYETWCFAAALEFNKKSFTSSVEVFQ